MHDGAKKLLLEEVTPEPEAAPAAPENPRHPKKKKAGPALRCIGVRGTSGREYRADAVLVATGGVSYPTTGSTGDGYKLAQQAGHTLIEPVPSPVSYTHLGCSVALGICWKSGVAAEVIGLPNGSIGDALYRAKITLSTGELFAWTFVIILLSAGFEKLFLLLLDLSLIHI